MFCEYDNDVYRNYKLGKMIKLFFEERIKNDNQRHPHKIKLSPCQLEIKSMPQSVNEQLRDKSANELWEVLIEQEKKKRIEAKIEKQRLYEKTKQLKAEMLKVKP